MIRPYILRLFLCDYAFVYILCWLYFSCSYRHGIVTPIKIGSIFPWNFNQNTSLFIHENATFCAGEMSWYSYGVGVLCFLVIVSSIRWIFSFDSHHDDVIMSAIASQITSFTIVYSTVYSGADKKKHESTASLAFVRGIHRGPVNSPHK